MNRDELNEISGQIIDAAMTVHTELGLGPDHQLPHRPSPRRHQKDGE
jgi:hypothetical protein